MRCHQTAFFGFLGHPSSVKLTTQKEEEEKMALTLAGHVISKEYSGIHAFPRTKATAEQVSISLYQYREDENPISFRTLSPKISHLF